MHVTNAENRDCGALDAQHDDTGKLNTTPAQKIEARKCDPDDIKAGHHELRPRALNGLTVVSMLQMMLAFALLALPSLHVVTAGSPSLESIIGNIVNDSIQVYFPGEPGYQNASRPFNARFDFEPFAVAYPNSTEEVAELVKAGAWLGVPGTSDIRIIIALVLTIIFPVSQCTFWWALIRGLRSWRSRRPLHNRSFEYQGHIC